ncbi:fimbrial biogenesis chaperone, partial [Enterobacter hormaechei]|uniref:fimbrial biogenesis chaperone n=1 Tax=Enterobacter hormaechei TaxID=158836 RepID=UPI001EFDBB28
MRHGYLLSTLLLVAASAQAGVVINGTRLVYQGDKKESSLGLSNPDTTDYLVQSWVDSGGKNQAKAPFLITPPLFRLDAKEDNVGNDSNLLIVFYVQIMPDDFVMQLHR